MEIKRILECPNCGTTYNVYDRKRSDFVPLGVRDFTGQGNAYNTLAVLTQCPTCFFCSVVYIENYSEFKTYEQKLNRRWKVTGWFPQTYDKADDRLPEPYYSDLSEAIRCLTGRCPNAASLMCRRIISQIAIAQGAPSDKTTGAHLGYLNANGLIEPKLLEIARAIKNFGDDGAHPPDEVTMEDAEKIVRVTDKILYYILILHTEFE